MFESQINDVPTVYIVDDDEGQRELLGSILRSSSFRVQEFSSGEQMLSHCDRNTQGCVVSDMLMPGMTGLDMQQKMRDKDVNLPVIFVSAYADVATVKLAMKLGAVDFFEKPVMTVELISAVKEALTIDSELRARQTRINHVHEKLNLLSKRERGVLDLLVSGLSNKQIATELNLSLRTVETHRNNILNKMEVGSFNELLRLLLSIPWQ
ncbi:response regulator transcription factor [Paraneptunicella aestuarii]|uniref:response regulator transcription factor n=1 Tax=Paraneptunicella aestuarii TaxID=2831148 RepID=UPI001E36DDA5|nr:response regulator [Paraneptunicella aestuarii]UAA39008.1 response regulator transcription factor [Paraneptunicella aestuarii]